jgi:hypothetical protein
MNEHRNAPVIADSIGATLAPVGTECQKLPYVPPYVTRLSPCSLRAKPIPYSPESAFGDLNIGPS